MENHEQASASPPRESKNSREVADESTDGQFIVVGQRLLYSTSCITLSPEDIRGLDADVAMSEGCSSSGDEHEEVNVITASISDTDPAKAAVKPDSQWKGFIRKLKKGPSMNMNMNFQTFHPSISSIPHILSIKKLSSRKRAPRGTQSLPELPTQLDGDLYYCFETSWKCFTLADLKEATSNFSQGNLVGEGGYSEVYKGHLEDGQLVAVKRLIRGSQEEMTEDFLNELGILVHVNHPNISRVIGYGVEGGMHLVLPLSANGSLSSLLKDEKEKLTWKLRYSMAVSIASGLSYLHEGCQRRIIHRDIKAANILLTEDLQPQISDFGLAKWLPDQWTHLSVSNVEGTFGYLPPEFFLHGTVDEKTDVYAYGVLLLEIISGRPAIDDQNKSVVMWAKPLLVNKNLVELADPSLDGNYDWDELNRVVMVATLCIHLNSTDRPQMSQVVRMLQGDEGILQSKNKFQKRPALKRTCPVEVVVDDESNSTKTTSHRNHKTESALEGIDKSLL